MLKSKNYQFWFCTGSQDLYGDECLANVAVHSQKIVEELNKSGNLPFEVVWKPTLITNELIRKTFNEANMDENCAGVITWMHTFSPAKSWILGLQEFRKPLLHLHTQFNREIPWNEIDMDFMNLNQSAHGDREHGFIGSRLRMARKVIVGYWEDEEPQTKLANWMRSACGYAISQELKWYVSAIICAKLPLQRVIRLRLKSSSVGTLNTDLSAILLTFLNEVTEAEIDAKWLNMKAVIQWIRIILTLFVIRRKKKSL